ncbi:hypothetical protein ACFQNE_03265 [Gordonia phosphorivorans]|uniref:Uncharacterized protein n=1 Tax=Gordonia phosphorivorans TaxID=1056982 RepID=A0ABV6H4L9_9ACTN
MTATADIESPATVATAPASLSHTEIGVGYAGEYVRALGWQVLDADLTHRRRHFGVLAVDGDELVAVLVVTRSLATFATVSAAADPATVAQIRDLAARRPAPDGAGEVTAVRVDCLILQVDWNDPHDRSAVQVRHYRDL